MSTTFINPSSLNMASTSSSSSSPNFQFRQSTPSSSSSSSPRPSSDEDHAAGPSRKRARSDGISSEERKEARAHRNRIAAQNSRDRRKAHYSFLEQKVSQLEEENRQLRCGIAIPLSKTSQQIADEQAREQRELARERENAELKERIKTLESGWEAVVKALAAQGLPNLFPSTSTGPITTSLPRTIPAITGSQQPQQLTQQQPSYPSPAPSYASLTHSPQMPSADIFNFDQDISTRHLARVAYTGRPSLALSSVSLQRVDLSRRLSSQRRQLVQRAWTISSERSLRLRQRKLSVQKRKAPPSCHHRR